MVRIATHHSRNYTVNGVITLKVLNDHMAEAALPENDVVIAVHMTDAQKEQMAAHYGIPRTLLTFHHERPPVIAIHRVEEVTAIYFQIPHRDVHTVYGLHTIGVILSPRAYCLVSEADSAFLRMMGSRIRFGGKLPEVISDIVDCYLDEVHLFEKQITELTMDTKRTPGDGDLREAFAISQRLVHLSSGLDSVEMILEDGEKQVLIADDLDAYKAKNKLKYTNKELNRYTSILAQAIDLIEGLINNRLNVIMRFLTVITIAVNVPMIIGGFWGMNVTLPFQNMYMAFSILVTTSVVLTALTMIGLWRN